MGGHGVAEGRRVARQEDEHGCLKVVWKFWEHQGSQEFESGCLSIVRICMFLQYRRPCSCSMCYSQGHVPCSARQFNFSFCVGPCHASCNSHHKALL